MSGRGSSSGSGSKKKSKGPKIIRYLCWDCSNCTAGGMTVSMNDYCPSCGHPRCRYCKEYPVESLDV